MTKKGNKTSWPTPTASRWVSSSAHAQEWAFYICDLIIELNLKPTIVTYNPTICARMYTAAAAIKRRRQALKTNLTGSQHQTKGRNLPLSMRSAEGNDQPIKFVVSSESRVNVSNPLSKIYSYQHNFNSYKSSKENYPVSIFWWRPKYRNIDQCFIYTFLKWKCYHSDGASKNSYYLLLILKSPAFGFLRLHQRTSKLKFYDVHNYSDSEQLFPKSA